MSMLSRSPRGDLLGRDLGKDTKDSTPPQEEMNSSADPNVDAETKPMSKLSVTVIVAVCVLGIVWVQIVYMFQWPIYALTALLLPITGGVYFYFRTRRSSSEADEEEAPTREAAEEDTPESPTKRPKSARSPDPSKAIPTMGLPAALYWLLRRVGRPDIVPRLSKKELRITKARSEEEQAVAQEAANDQFLHDVFNPTRKIVDGSLLVWTSFRGVIAVLCQKGGAAKSVTAAILAAIIAMYTRGANVLLLAATQNPGSSTMKAGVSREETITLLELEELLLELTENRTKRANPNDVRDKIRRNQYGVYVIAQSMLPDDFDGDRYRWILEQLREIFDIIVQDTGNVVGRVGSVEYEAARQADHLIFTAWTGMPDSPTLMGETMDTYASLNHRGKLTRCSVVISGVEGDLNATKTRLAWAMYAEARVNDYGVPVGVRDFPFKVIKHNDGDAPSGALHLIGNDPFLASEAVPVLEELSQDTLRRYKTMAVDVIRRIGMYQGKDFAVLDSILMAKLAAKEFDYIAVMATMMDEMPTFDETSSEDPPPAR